MHQYHAARLSTEAFPSGYASTTYASNFKSGDFVLLVSASSPTKYTTTRLTAAGTSTTCTTLTGVPSCSTSYPSGFVSMTFSPTAAGGTNDSTDDPLLMTQNAPSTELSSSFCSTDWVLRLQPITYTVSTSNTINGIEDPQLVRTQAGTSSVLMDQVVGFKVGAAWWNNDTDTYTTATTRAPIATPLP